MSYIILEQNGSRCMDGEWEVKGNHKYPSKMPKNVITYFQIKSLLISLFSIVQIIQSYPKTDW